MVVHAIWSAAEAFYRYHGFIRLPVGTPPWAVDLAKFAGIAPGE
jgi:hypothetical protein